MAQVSNYQLAGELVDKVEKNLDTPERILAAAHVDALRAVVDQLALLTAALEALRPLTELAPAVSEGANLLRDQIRASGGT